MIKYNLENINDWNNGSDNVKKVYYKGKVCYHKVTNTKTEDTYLAHLTLNDGTVIDIEDDGTGVLTRAMTPAYKDDIVSAEITDNCTSIGNQVFYSCVGLTSVTIPDSVTSIGTFAFERCSGLTSVTIGNNVTSIGARAFNSCSGLTSVTIGNSVTSIGSNAFYQCYSLASVTIPNSVTSFGSAAFKNCSGLTSVVIGSGVTSIGIEAFNGCTSLEEIIVKGLVPATIRSNVFNNTNNCPITVDCSVEELYKQEWSDYADRIQCDNPPVGDYKWLATYQGGTTASAECDSTSEIVQYEIPKYDAGINLIISVEVGDCVTELGESLFLSDSSLTALTIPDTVINIGNSAFYNCTNVSNIKISANLETIGEGAFEGIRFPDAITLGNVITISDDAFRNCVSLPSVKIGDKITSIGGRAFDSCTNLTGVIIEATTPPTLGKDAFRFTNDCPLLVPAQSVDTYKSASGWSEYASRIQAIP